MVTIAAVSVFRRPFNPNHAIRIAATAVRFSWTRHFSACRSLKTSAITTAIQESGPAKGGTYDHTDEARRLRRESRTVWTPQMDRVLVEGRQEGKTYTQIGAKLGIADYMVLCERAARLRRLAGETSKTYRAWEKSDVEHLVSRYKAGVSTLVIAQELKRTRTSVQSMMRRMANQRDPLVTVRRTYKKRTDAWSADQSNTLVRMRNAGVSWRQIAAELGRSPNACKFQGSALQAAAVSKRWGAEEDARLTSLRLEQGLKWAQIAQRIPGRTPAALERRAYGLGVLPIERQKSTYARAIWGADEDSRLTSLRLEQGLKWAQIAQHFPGRTPAALSKRGHVLGIVKRRKPTSARGPGEQDPSTRGPESDRADDQNAREP